MPINIKKWEIINISTDQNIWNSHVTYTKIESQSYHSSVSHHGDIINKIQTVRKFYMTKEPVSLTTMKNIQR